MAWVSVPAAGQVPVQLWAKGVASRVKLRWSLLGIWNMWQYLRVGLRLAWDLVRVMGFVG